MTHPSPIPRFLRFFCPLALLVLAGGFLYWNSQKAGRLAAAQSSEMARMVREAKVIELAFAARAGDAAYLAERIEAELSHGSAPLPNIQELLLSYASIKRDYLVVRFVDATGMEVVRVDMGKEGPSLVQESQLQDKSDRPVFRQAMALRGNRRALVHVSRMDLIVEQGRIVEPVQPTVHFTGQVRDWEGKAVGLVVLSLDANIPLDRLREAASVSLGRPMLINENGYWLLGPAAPEEWGFLFPDRKDKTLEAVWPGAWERMRGQEQGQFLLDGSLITFVTVHARSSGGLRQATQVFPVEDWRIVSRVEPGRLSPPLAGAFAGMVAGLLILLAASCWFWAQASAKRAQAQEALRRSEEQARAILNAPQDAAFFLLDLNGTVLAANQVAEKRFQDITPGSIIGRSLWDVGPRDLAMQRKERFEKSAATGEAVRFEDTRQGMILDNTFYPVRSGSGETTAMAAMSRDVTIQRQAQRKALLLARAVEQSPAVIVITGDKGDIEYVNPSFTTRYGYSQEEALGRNPRILQSGLHDRAFYQDMWDTLTSGRDWAGEICNRAKDDRIIWEKAIISPVLDEAGSITHFVAVKEDVTEQRAVLKRLEEEEAMVRAMSEASQDALIMINDAGRVTFWNPAAERIFGYGRDEALGREVHPLVATDEDIARSAPALSRFARSGLGAAVGNVLELTARGKDGSAFPVELALGAFRHQERWWAVATVRDITERKRAERMLHELATTDSLTGLANRRHFMERGNAELERGRRTGHWIGCLMFDVDHFKKVNDAHGHEAGDMVLKSLARTARETLRSIDILGRLGGEEFAALLPETGQEASLRAAERLRQAVEGMSLDCGGVVVSVTISLGVAQSMGAEDSLEALLKRADAALYEAKRSGRNRTVLAHDL